MKNVHPQVNCKMSGRADTQHPSENNTHTYYTQLPSNGVPLLFIPLFCSLQVVIVRVGGGY